MNSYLLFLGCLIQNRFPFMEVSLKKVLDSFEVEVKREDGFSCCPAPKIRGYSYKTWLYIAARNLCLAEEKGLDILTPCNGCYETLKVACETLKEKPNLKDEVNKVLSEFGMEFLGKTKVLHLVELLYREIGIEKIEKKIQKPLNLKVAVHYGCHLLKPSKYLKFDSPETPKSLDLLVEATGAKSIPYMMKNYCCGEETLDKEVSFALARQKLSRIKKVASCMVVVCPACMFQYDLNQPLIQKMFNEKYEIPVFYYPELLCLALGEKPEDLGFQFHRVKVDSVLEGI
ncbi:MAG: CoB--CoM heterodisulfide reductase iron-sulfur subunit B family protein [Candidatus Methanofastidiosia archaeon]